MYFRHYNINKLTEQNLKEILGILGDMGNHIDKQLDISEVCKRYNQKLVFEPEAHSNFLICYFNVKNNFFISAYFVFF